jgi:hypothetical protein
MKVNSRCPGGRGLAYRTFANSVANALRGDCSRARPPRFLRSGRCSIRTALGAACEAVAVVVVVAGCSARGTSLPFGGWAGLARNRRSSSGARSNLRMIDCISSDVGASTKANPFDSCVSWFRITFTASATRSSAASHCLISSAVTQTGRLPRKTVKLIQLILLLRWLDLRHFKGRICHIDSIRVSNPIAND